MTTEELSAELERLRVEFEEFKALAMPVIIGHQPMELTLPPILPPRQ